MATVPFTAAGQDACETYEVQAGDTLSNIARDKLGSSAQFLEIAAINAAASQRHSPETVTAKNTEPASNTTAH